MSKVAVFGAGSWGTAFSIVLADGGNDVTMWARREEVAEAINEQRENPDYLPGIELPRRPWPRPTTSRRRCTARTSSCSRRRRSRCATTSPSGRRTSSRDAVMVSLMKGVELGTLKRMSEVIDEVTGAGPERIAVISGPNLAKEIARREPAASVVACEDADVAEMLQDRCHSPAFRPYTSVDVLGCELGGAYKNVVGLAVGMAVGLGFGDNTTASVITRGLAETARLAMKLGANPLTLMGLAGLGDLVATCSSPLSRNRTFGEKLGQGMTADEIYASTRQVAEGAKSCSSLRALAERSGVDAPIAQNVDEVVAGRDDRPGHAWTPSSPATPRPRPTERGRPSTGRASADGVEVAPAVGPVRLETWSRPRGRSGLTSSMPTDSRTRPSGIVAARSSSGGAARASTRRRPATWRAPRAWSCA